MTTPTEILYWEILPTLRKELVLALIDLGLKQSQIAKLLEITPSAISQYMKSKRASEFKFENEFKSKIINAAKKIKDGTSTPFDQINHLIKEFEKSKELCKLCCKRNNMDSCNACD